jgi:hypothetical protein
VLTLLRIGTFREALTRARIDGKLAVEVLFKAYEAALTNAGCPAMGGRIIDASIVAAPKQRHSRSAARGRPHGGSTFRPAPACAMMTGGLSWRRSCPDWPDSGVPSTAELAIERLKLSGVSCEPPRYPVMIGRRDLIRWRLAAKAGGTEMAGHDASHQAFQYAM